MGKDGNATGGILMIEIKEQELRNAAAIALNQSYRSGERLVAMLNDVDTSAPLVKIISNLSPFLALADRMALVWFDNLLITPHPNGRQLHPYVNIAWQVTSLVIRVSSPQYRNVMTPVIEFGSDSKRPDRSR